MLIIAWWPNKKKRDNVNFFVAPFTQPTKLLGSTSANLITLLGTTAHQNAPLLRDGARRLCCQLCIGVGFEKTCFFFVEKNNNK